MLRHIRGSARIARILCRLALPLGLAVAANALAGPSVFPTGVTRYDPGAAYDCYVLFSDLSHKTYLIDMDGNVVHEWNQEGFPARMVAPALVGGARGEIGVQLQLVPAGSRLGGLGLVPGRIGAFRDLTIGYVDWQGKTLWEWGTAAPGGAALQHHDWALLANGETLVLGSRVGPLPGFGTRAMLDPVIYEVNRAGHIVWRWRASEHLAELGFTGARLKMLEDESAADYLHMNAMAPLGRNHWAAAGDSRFAPDNILISSRNGNFLAIISRNTGRIVWRLGPDFAPPKRPYGDLAKSHEVPFELDGLSGQHDAHMIPEGLPGAGNLLVFDNEGEGGYPPAVLAVISGSRVLEINPVTRQVVWQYTGTKASFFSPFISSAQRLANGNTLIDEGIWGRFFQVTPQGRIVWEYLSPFRGGGGQAGMVYRAQAVPYDWVPNGTPHSEHAVTPPVLSDYHVPTSKP